MRIKFRIKIGIRVRQTWVRSSCADMGVGFPYTCNLTLRQPSPVIDLGGSLLVVQLREFQKLHRG